MNYSCCHQPADSRSEAHVWCNKLWGGRRKKLGQTVSLAVSTVLKVFISIPNVFNLRREESRDHWGTIEQQLLILSNVMDLIGCRKTQTRQKCHKKRIEKMSVVVKQHSTVRKLTFMKGLCFPYLCQTSGTHIKKKRPWERDRLWWLEHIFIMQRISYHPGIAPPQRCSSDLELKTETSTQMRCQDRCIWTSALIIMLRTHQLCEPSSHKSASLSRFALHRPGIIWITNWLKLNSVTT